LQAFRQHAVRVEQERKPELEPSVQLQGLRALGKGVGNDREKLDARLTRELR
jgi:hypothetical protein